MRDVLEIDTEKERALAELRELAPVERAEFSVGKKAFSACKAAGGAMVKAMTAQAKSRSSEERIEACRLAGVAPDDAEKEAAAALTERAKDAVGAFADAHLKAHSLQYMEDFRLYSLADRSVYAEISPFAYDRDRVDAAIAEEARARWAKLSLAPPDKSSLLVGKYCESAEAVFEVNCHSPVPLKSAASKIVRVPEGALRYNVLKGEKLENNELNAQEKTKTTEKTFEKETLAETKKAETVNRDREPEAVDARRASLPKKAPFRPHPEDPEEPNRKRTALAAEIIHAEKRKRGVLLSPDPLLAKQPKLQQVKEQ